MKILSDNYTLYYQEYIIKVLEKYIIQIKFK
jgi:hypothetical protein